MLLFNLSHQVGGDSSVVERTTYNQEVPGLNPALPGEAANAGSGYVLCSCQDNKPQN